MVLQGLRKAKGRPPEDTGPTAALPVSHLEQGKGVTQGRKGRRAVNMSESPRGHKARERDGEALLLHPSQVMSEPARLCPLRTPMLKSESQCDGIKRWALWEVTQS